MVEPPAWLPPQPLPVPAETAPSTWPIESVPRQGAKSAPSLRVDRGAKRQRFAPGRHGASLCRSGGAYRNRRRIQTLSCSIAITMTSTTTVRVATLSYWNARM